jgi:hypothetical protein
MSEAAFPLPLWLIWMRDTVRALGVWHELVSEIPNLRFDDKFTSEAWNEGVRGVVDGYPSVALELWRDFTRQLHEDIQKEAEALSNATQYFRKTLDLAAQLQMAGPMCPESGVDAERLMSAISMWRETNLVGRINQLFWQIHKQFLINTRSREYPPLKESFKHTLTQLINSANRGGPPQFTECLALCRTHEEVLAELLPYLSGRIIISCPQCEVRLRVPVGKQGRVRCARCGHVFNTST